MAAEINQIAKDHGWWETDRNFGEMLALVHSEISEALESYRNHEPAFFTKAWQNTPEKPEGWGIELLDAIIRILDILHSNNLDIDHLIRLKMDYNKTRPYKHGGKKF